MNLTQKLHFFQTIGYNPHPGQLKLHQSEARFRLLACGARWGKTTAASREAMAAMMMPDSMGWVAAPTYALSAIMFSQILYGWMKARPEVVEDYSESKMFIRLANGAVCQGKSTDNPAGLLGVGLDWLCYDEPPVDRGDVWDEFLQPRLIDRKGWALLTGTPKGKGKYHQLYLKGKETSSSYDPEYHSQEGPTWDNPKVDKEWLLGKRKDYNERFWRQEVLGEFLDDSGSVFSHVRSHIAGTMEEPTIGKAYSVGVDLAKHQDWTVITVMNMDGHVVYWIRLQHEMSWPAMRAVIKDVSKKYNNATCYVDSSGVGDPTMDDLLKEGVPAIPVKTAQEKTQLIDALTVAFETGKITYPDIPILLNELEIFEYEKTGTGRDAYNAPEGFHDDAVISLSLAWRGVHTDIGVSEGWI